MPPPPAADAGATAAPAGDATATTAAPAASPSDKPYFKLVNKRMWTKSENGACSGQHLLRINVIDANGVRINGVRLKGIYTGEEIVTGSQGKGDGMIEYDLYGTGEGFRSSRTTMAAMPKARMPKGSPQSRWISPRRC